MTSTSFWTIPFSSHSANSCIWHKAGLCSDVEGKREREQHTGKLAQHVSKVVEKSIVSSNHHGEPILLDLHTHTHVHTHARARAHARTHGRTDGRTHANTDTDNPTRALELTTDTRLGPC